MISPAENAGRAKMKRYKKFKRRNKFYLIVPLSLIVCFLISGCGSLKLHERKADESNPADQGSVTELELKGPKAQLSHKF